MKKLLVIIITLCFVPWAFAEPYEVEIADSTTRGGAMGLSGTSTCPVIDLSKLRDIDGRFTFQLKSLGGATNVPLGTSTITVSWKGSNVNDASAWANANTNTFISAINALTGATDVGYDINDSGSGVTPYRFIRLQYTNGAAGNIAPLGVLFVR